jgi:hypothetical protein
MALYDADYEVFCESIKRRESEARVWGQEEISKTISTGQMPTAGTTYLSIRNKINW